MEIRNELESLKADVAEITRVMKERAAAGQMSEVKELSEKLEKLSKEVAERKHQFEVEKSEAFKGDRKEIDKKLDELFIAKQVLTLKDGSFDRAEYGKLAAKSDYRDALKASGFSFNPATPDGQVTGNDGTASGYGSDLVVPGFSTTLLEEIYLKLEIAALFDRINMPNATFQFPFITDRLTARLGHEGSAPEKDKIATSHLIFTAKKLLCNIDLTDEMEQDSLLPILPILRKKLVESFALAQEQIALNGDTTAAAGNINGNIAADDARRTVSGLRKLSNANVDFGGTFDADKLRALRAAMGKYGKNPSDLVYIMSMAAYNKCLGFTGYQYLYQYAGSVIANGELGRIDNIPIIVSELIPENLGATGVYDAVGTKSCVVLAHKDGFMWGDRKQFGLETYRNVYQGVNSLVGSQRLDFQKVLSTASKPVAVGINF